MAKTRTNQPVLELDKDIQNAVQADKEVISKIKMTYDEQGSFTDIYFPKGIMPLQIRALLSGIDTDMYFRFDNDEIVDENGTKLFDCEYHAITQGKLNITIANQDLTNTLEIKSMTYIVFDSNSSVKLINDTYHLYFPINEGGTQLYEHRIAYSYSGGLPARFYFISQVATKEEVNNSISELTNNVKTKRFSSSAIFINGSSETSPSFPANSFTRKYLDGNNWVDIPSIPSSYVVWTITKL